MYYRFMEYVCVVTTALMVFECYTALAVFSSKEYTASGCNNTRYGKKTAGKTLKESRLNFKHAIYSPNRNLREQRASETSTSQHSVHVIRTTSLRNTLAINKYFLVITKTY